MNTPQLSLAEQLTAVFNSIANIVRKPNDSAQEDRAGANVSDTIVPESKQPESAAQFGSSTEAMKTNLNMSKVQKAAEKETFIIEEGYGLEREEVPEYIPTPIKRAETKYRANDKREKNEEQTVTVQKGEGKSEVATGNSVERDSDIREDDIVDLEDENMSFSSPVKRSRGEEEKGSCSHKKARLEEGESLRVDVKDICEKTMMKIEERSERWS